jgi:hypothetical protein
MKQIVYKYDDDRRPDEMDFDARGPLTFTKGDIISRHETSWRIESVERESSVDNLLRIPTYWICLTHVVVN